MRTRTTITRDIRTKRHKRRARQTNTMPLPMKHSVDQHTASQSEINSIVTDALQFISGLKFTLNQGLPQEKLYALRRCIERILIDKPGKSVIVKIKAVPASMIKEVEELARELGPADVVVPGYTESIR